MDPILLAKKCASESCYCRFPPEIEEMIYQDLEYVFSIDTCPEGEYWLLFAWRYTYEDGGLIAVWNNLKYWCEKYNFQPIFSIYSIQIIDFPNDKTKRYYVRTKVPEKYLK